MSLTFFPASAAVCSCEMYKSQTSKRQKDLKNAKIRIIVEFRKQESKKGLSKVKKQEMKQSELQKLNEVSKAINRQIKLMSKAEFLNRYVMSLSKCVANF
jgi:protein subunit release factor B